MQRRLVGSVVVVAAGLLPALVGGPVFALLMLGIGVVALSEFLNFRRPSAPSMAHGSLYAALVLAAGGALFSRPVLLFLAVLLGMFFPLAFSLRLTQTPGAADTWSWGVAGVCYIGIPMYAAIALRQAAGTGLSSTWQSLADRLALGWAPAAGGMAWVLAVVLSTWAGDSAAYLAGRAFGRRKLAPAVSPGKTVEGALGGLLAATVVSAAVFGVSGGLAVWAGALVGAAIGIFGQLGDLSESFLKRQAGVKDSGDLIPGHGGMLDRVDALLFAFPAALLMFWIAEGSVR
jgi:phosphatidate cytidylyltransferase